MDSSVSPAAQLANRRLIELRAQLAAQRGELATAEGAAAVRAGAGEGAPVDHATAEGAGAVRRAPAVAWLAAHRYAPPAAGGAMPVASTAGKSAVARPPSQGKDASHSLSLLACLAGITAVVNSQPQVTCAATGPKRPTGEAGPAGSRAPGPLAPVHRLTAAEAPPQSGYGTAGQGQPLESQAPPTTSSHSLSDNLSPVVPPTALWVTTTRHRPVGEGRPAERIAAAAALPPGPSAADSAAAQPPAGYAVTGRSRPAITAHGLDSGLAHDGEASAPATTRAAGASGQAAASAIKATADIIIKAVEIHLAIETTAPTAGQAAAPSLTGDLPGDSIAALADRIATLPPHLGWGSETLTAHLRAAAARDRRYEIRDTSEEGAPSANPAQGNRDHHALSPWERAGERGSLPARPSTLENADSTFQDARYEIGDRNEESALDSYLVSRISYLKIYPDIALGILRAERAAAGRVWLLLRHLDDAGRGMVGVAAARAALCDRESPLHLCGRRRLRQLLAEGEGLFWTRDAADRLWLRGPVRVAAALGVRRLANRPVAVPVAALLGCIGDARAQLYATFHSGRARELLDAGAQGCRGAGEKEGPPTPLRPCAPASPISRAALTALSGACARSQAAYERRAGVLARSNVALGERVADGAHAVVGPAEQERAWQCGRALFRLKDYRGHYGHPGAVYLAWRLPNGYGPARGQQQRPRGRQKRINRRLTDLFTQGMTGNGRAATGKRFFGTAVGAVKAGQGAGGQGKRPAEVHWPIGRARSGVGVWATLGPASFFGE